MEPIVEDERLRGSAKLEQRRRWQRQAARIRLARVFAWGALGGGLAVVLFSAIVIEAGAYRPAWFNGSRILTCNGAVIALVGAVMLWRLGSRLSRCGECGLKLKGQADACPRCGSPEPRARTLGAWAEYPELDLLETRRHRAEAMRAVSSAALTDPRSWKALVFPVVIMVLAVASWIAFLNWAALRNNLVVGIPLWILMMASGPFSRRIFLSALHRRLLREHLQRCGIPICIECGYDLRGSASGICPECGTAYRLPRHRNDDSSRYIS